LYQLVQIGVSLAKYNARQDAHLVQQESVRPSMDVLEVALMAKHELRFAPIRENEKHEVKAICGVVLQEDGLTQLLDERLAPSEEVRVVVIGREQEEVKVGVGVGRATGIGAA